MELRHPYVLQYICQLTAILHQMQQPQMLTPQLMLSTLEQLRLEVGIGGPLSELLMDIIHEYMTDTWWKDLLHYL